MNFVCGHNHYEPVFCWNCDMLLIYRCSDCNEDIEESELEYMDIKEAEYQYCHCEWHSPEQPFPWEEENLIPERRLS